jgi:hypothetical protein
MKLVEFTDLKQDGHYDEGYVRGHGIGLDGAPGDGHRRARAVEAVFAGKSDSFQKLLVEK